MIFGPACLLKGWRGFLGDGGMDYRKCGAAMPEGAVFCYMCGVKQVQDKKRYRRGIASPLSRQITGQGGGTPAGDLWGDLPGR